MENLKSSDDNNAEQSAFGELNALYLGRVITGYKIDRGRGQGVHVAIDWLAFDSDSPGGYVRVSECHRETVAEAIGLAIRKMRGLADIAEAPRRMRAGRP